MRPMATYNDQYKRQQIKQERFQLGLIFLVFALMMTAETIVDWLVPIAG